MEQTCECLLVEVDTALTRVEVDVAVEGVTVLKHRSNMRESISIQLVVYFGVTWLAPKHHSIFPLHLVCQVHQFRLVDAPMCKASLPR